MTGTIHPQVQAEIEALRAREELELERLVSARNSLSAEGELYSVRAASLAGRIAEKKRVVAGWRKAVLAVALAGNEDTPEPEPSPTVAYRTHSSRWLYCVQCVAIGNGPYSGSPLIPFTSEDLDHGGVCAVCHADVLA